MDIFTKAKELGSMIFNSDEMMNFRMWEENLERDVSAKAILQEYQIIQREMLVAAQENLPKNILDEIKERLVSKHDEVNNCEIAISYLESKDKLDNLIKRVNDVLIYTISGEQPCEAKGCSSCGGSCK